MPSMDMARRIIDLTLAAGRGHDPKMHRAGGEGMAVSEQAIGGTLVGRFFKATALAGALHLLDIPDWGPFDAARVTYREQDEVKWLVRAGAGKRRIVRTAADLDRTLEESRTHRVAINLYVQARLLGEARTRWEQTRGCAVRPGDPAR